MSQPKWTPGPWRAFESRSSVGTHAVQDSDGYWCFQTVGGTIRDNQEANAHLIAAAPEMYGHLRDLYSDLVQGANPSQEELDAIGALLAKARGEGGAT